MLNSGSSQTSNGAPSGSNHSADTSQTVLEHRRLFNRQLRTQPYTGRRPNSRSGLQGGRSVAKEKTFQRTMVCLADKDQLNVPTSAEKITLRNNSIGEKKVSIPALASADRVKEVLYEAFPPLKSCGGFELLLTEEKSRTKLRVVKYGSVSADELRCFGSGRIYIRPIQVDIFLGDEDVSDDQREQCFLCKIPIPLREMRDHIELCMGGTSSTNNESSRDDSLPPAFDDKSEDTQDNHSDDTFSQTVATHHNDRNDANDVIVVQRESALRGDTHDNHSDGTSSQAVATHHNDRNDASDLIVVQQESPLRDQIAFEVHRRKAIEDTLLTMATCEEPVAIFREYCKKFLRGRPLDVESESELCEGRTIEIFVSRFNLYEEAMTELITDPPLEDISYPLEVTFSGEEAADYGGPRKEFLCAIIREIKDKLFQEVQNGQYKLFEDDNSLRKNHYYAAGLIFGLSMIQDGPLPSFLDEDQLQRLLSETTSLSETEKQFQSGFALSGLLELIRRKPILIYLLRKTAVLPEINRSKIIKIMKPRFSEQGSNRRFRENQVYRTFLDYLKEVQAGRRRPVTMEKILKFVTGSEVESILGYRVSPHITFNHYAASCLPTSRTCINRLTLATGSSVPSDQDMYNFFDIAFVNDYFGNA